MAQELQSPVFQLHFDTDNFPTDSCESASHNSVPAKKIRQGNKMKQTAKDQKQNADMTQTERREQFTVSGRDFVFDNTEQVYDPDNCSQYKNNVSDNGREFIDPITIQPDHQNESVQKYNSFSEVLREVSQESKMVVLQYSQTFGDIEAYEQQGSQAVSDLKAHADSLHQNFMSQRELFCDHLKKISDILKSEF